MTTALADAPPLIGECPFAVVAYVPREVQVAIAEWALRRANNHTAWARYCEVRDMLEDRVSAGEHVDMTVLDEFIGHCRACEDMLEEAAERIRRLIPCDHGWYPHGDYVWGWAKRSPYGGLELVREPSSRRLDDDAARRDRARYYEALGRQGGAR